MATSPSDEDGWRSWKKKIMVPRAAAGPCRYSGVPLDLRFFSRNPLLSLGLPTRFVPIPTFGPPAEITPMPTFPSERRERERQERERQERERQQDLQEFREQMAAFEARVQHANHMQFQFGLRPRTQFDEEFDYRWWRFYGEHLFFGDTWPYHEEWQWEWGASQNVADPWAYQ